MSRSLYTISLYLITLFLVPLQGFGQERFFQVTGIITDVENKAIPNVGVISLKLRRGTLSGKTGIYSLTSTPGDTIFFRALGFKRRLLILPNDFEGRNFNLDVTLSLDTIPIDNVTVIPWKSYSEFIKDMTKPTPIDPEIENMNRNLATIAEAVANTKDVRITPEAGYHYAMQQSFNVTSIRTQGPVNNLLNPFAWAKFINGLKHGLLKNQDVEKSTKAKNKKKKKNK